MYFLKIKLKLKKTDKKTKLMTSVPSGERNKSSKKNKINNILSDNMIKTGFTK